MFWIDKSELINMDVFKQLPNELQHKILLHFKNPICDILMKYWREQMFFQRQDLLVDLNRYNYFRKNRKPIWDKCKEDGITLLFDFEESGETADWTYAQCLENGWWKQCNERNKGKKLRLALFNTLESGFWSYHGDINNPEAIQDTVYDPLETKRDIERDFDVRVRGDRGHPSYSHEEWTRRCGEDGSISLSQRRYLRAPRCKDGTWDNGKALSKITAMRVKNKKSHLRRTWCRWRGGGQDANEHHSYYELCYHQ